ncbi:hypothetical protein BC6307_20945 [Sutcliffiella cohnii]|uniref:Glycosyltransferase 2-like domain-containing protein n=1 Tax=Sutcliffiella cohnii TaxID=33932 RepID=A0A223KVS6_9BACI|nr:glycosyltransferase family 2 protein [Sutcliffiella cohnii]AST93556.1 hypothetical protein BC6307_20945 [Sutcliffiella cohnii]
MQTQTISLCLMVKNEETFLRKCIESVQATVNEIIILDTGSTDKTIEIATEYTDQVKYKVFNGDFSAMRNEVLKYVQTDWVLFLDADEFFDETEIPKIKEAINKVSSDVGGIRFYRYNFFASGGWYSNKVLKLFRNNLEYKYAKKVNESIDTSIIQSGYLIEDSDIVLNHIGHTRSREDRDAKSKKYIQLMKEQLEETPNDPVLHGYIGLISRTLGDFDYAINKTTHALNINPNSSTLHMFHGHVLRSVNKNLEALDTYKKALELRPNDAGVLNMIGVMYMTLGNLAEAEEYFGKAFESNPALIHSLLNKGIVRFYQKDYLSAYEYFSKVIERNKSFLYKDIFGILECDPYKSFYYETYMEYSGLESYIAICESKMKEVLNY